MQYQDSNVQPTSESLPIGNANVGRSCQNCKFYDEFGFCTKLTMDTKRTFVEDRKPIKAYYLSERYGDDDDRSAFIVPKDFSCKYHEMLVA